MSDTVPRLVKGGLGGKALCVTRPKVGPVGFTRSQTCDKWHRTRTDLGCEHTTPNVWDLHKRWWKYSLKIMCFSLWLFNMLLTFIFITLSLCAIDIFASGLDSWLSLILLGRWVMNIEHKRYDVWVLLQSSLGWVEKVELYMKQGWPWVDHLGS